MYILHIRKKGIAKSKRKGITYPFIARAKALV